MAVAGTIPDPGKNLLEGCRHVDGRRYQCNLFVSLRDMVLD
jgi:hypothetical protein